VAGGELMVNNMARDFFDPNLVEQFKARYRLQMQFRGFLRAILSSIRSGMLESFLDVYRQVGRTGLPILLLWGRNDTTVPMEHAGVLCAAMPDAEFHVIEDCGHIPHYERPDEVNPLLLAFLRK
jgi:pimeloyl-ACP methyl ester carboxylesterase